MRIRPAALAIVTALALSVGGVVVAAPASAGPSDLSPGCQALNAGSLPYPNVTNLHWIVDEAMSQGEEVFVNVTAPNPAGSTASLEVPDGSTVRSGIALPTQITFTIPSDVPSFTFAVLITDGRATFTSWGCRVASPHHATAPPPPPWVQGYGRATAETACADGWAPSWELWPNGGTGGWTCTRSIPSLG